MHCGQERRQSISNVVVHCSDKTSLAAEYIANRCNFCPRDAMPVRYLMSSRVCLSVRPSQVSVLLKRLNVGSQKQRHTIVQGLDLRRKRSLRNFEKCVFRPVDKYRRKFVSICYSGPRPRRCADGGMRGVINKVGCRKICR